MSTQRSEKLYIIKVFNVFNNLLHNVALDFLDYVKKYHSIKFILGLLNNQSKCISELKIIQGKTKVHYWTKIGLFSISKFSVIVLKSVVQKRSQMQAFLFTHMYVVVESKAYFGFVRNFWVPAISGKV